MPYAINNYVYHPLKPIESKLLACHKAQPGPFAQCDSVWVHEKEYSHASTDHQEQFLIGSSIFHSPWHTQGLWKHIMVWYWVGEAFSYQIGWIFWKVSCQPWPPQPPTPCNNLFWNGNWKGWMDFLDLLDFNAK